MRERSGRPAQARPGHVTRFVGLLVAVSLLATCSNSGNGTTADTERTTTRPLATPSDTVGYLLTYFIDDGSDGVHLATSTDGLMFTELSRRPDIDHRSLDGGLVRDPSITIDDDGTAHLVWTTGWGSNGFGYARSTDLETWSEAALVPAMEHQPSALNVWAPEVHWDEDADALRVVFASTVRDTHPSGDGEPLPDGAPSAHRLWQTTSPDGSDWAESAPLEIEDRNMIDGVIVAARDRFAMVVKDERLTPTPAKSLHVSWADDMAGPWEPLGSAIDTFGTWVEGPTLVRGPDDAWWLYADEYAIGSWGLATSEDLVTWTDRSRALVVPAGARHGTVTALTPGDVERFGLEEFLGS